MPTVTFHCSGPHNGSILSSISIQRYVAIFDIFTKVVRSNFRDQNCPGNHAIVRLLCPITEMPNADGNNIGVNFYLSVFQQ